MNFAILEMLYNIPELQDLSHQFYLQMPDREEREECLRLVWQDCKAAPDPGVQELFDRLESSENYVGGLQERAAFLTGMFLGWSLSRFLPGH